MRTEDRPLAVKKIGGRVSARPSSINSVTPPSSVREAHTHLLLEDRASSSTAQDIAENSAALQSDEGLAEHFPGASEHAVPRG